MKDSVRPFTVMLWWVVESSGSRRWSAAVEAVAPAREDDCPGLLLPGTIGEVSEGVDGGEADFWPESVDKGVELEAASGDGCGLASSPLAPLASVNMTIARIAGARARCAVRTLINLFSNLPSRCDAFDARKDIFRAKGEF